MTDPTTTPTSSAPHHSAIVGILLTMLGFISSPFVLHFLPEKWAALAQAIGAALLAFGITGQIKQNTQATTANTAAVTTAITTAAPVNMAPSPAIVAAGVSAGRNPLTNR